MSTAPGLNAGIFHFVIIILLVRDAYNKSFVPKNIFVRIQCAMLYGIMT